MARSTEASVNDYDRFRARTQHDHRYPSPQPQENERAESTLVGVGGRFGCRKESYPHDLEFSEGEDTIGQPSLSSRAESSFDALDTEPRSPSLDSPPTTPPPGRSHYGLHIQTFGLPLPPQTTSRRHHGRRRQNPSNRSRSSENTPARGRPHSNTTVDDPDEDYGNNERGRNITPTPYFPPPPSTPSQHSEETVEKTVDNQNEGREPASPHPYSAYYPYDPDRGRRGIDDFDQRFSG